MENGFLFVQEEKLIQQNDIISEKDITVSKLGIDFNARRIYFNGYLNYIISRKDFNITIFSF